MKAVRLKTKEALVGIPARELRRGQLAVIVSDTDGFNQDRIGQVVVRATEFTEDYIQILGENNGWSSPEGIKGLRVRPLEPGELIEVQ